MRKLLIVALTLAAVVSVVGVALAANTYRMHKASTSKPGKGSKARPIPTGITLGFQVGDTDPSKRGVPVEKYALGAEGIVTNPKNFPKCAFTDMDNEATVPSKCAKAKVGSGIAKNAAGPSTDQSLSASSPCNLDVRLYNNGSGMIIRLDSYGRPAPPDFGSNAIGCLLPIATAINGKFVKATIGGLAASDFRFTVPQNLKHPLAGIDNSIRESVSNIVLKSKLVRGKRIGFYQKIGCKGPRRTTRGTFTTEATASAPAQKSTATKQTKC
jgi:hypothetical protein